MFQVVKCMPPTPLQIYSSVFTSFLLSTCSQQIPENILPFPPPPHFSYKLRFILTEKYTSIGYMFQEESHPLSHLDLLAWWWLSANVCTMNAMPQKVTELLSKGSPCSAGFRFLWFSRTAHRPTLPVGTTVFPCQFTYVL